MSDGFSAVAISSAAIPASRLAFLSVRGRQRGQHRLLAIHTYGSQTPMW